ncbi:HupE/UreJ family protein [Myxococcota bacterium]|nr:HupE/UreJ family protein [Myxococcota bacterium]
MNPWRLRVAATLLVLCWLGVAQLTNAHTRSLSYSTWKLTDKGATVTARASRLDFTRLGIDPGASARDLAEAARYLAEHLTLRTKDGACPPQHQPLPLTAPEGWVSFGWKLECPIAESGTSNSDRTIHSSFLTAAAPSHLQFVRLEFPDGRILDQVLSRARPEFSFAITDPAIESQNAKTRDQEEATVSSYFGLGLEHILSGWDHLAFVIALLLLAESLREVAGLVTAFTVAHSVTLGLAALGVLQPDGAAVEALIGFSIALVAIENSWILSGRHLAIPLATLLALGSMTVMGTASLSRTALAGLALFSLCHFGLIERAHHPARLRAIIAFAFGLVHGFGFAGILDTLSLPTARLVPALFGFNVGVEVGQLAVVVAIWPILRALQHRDARKGRWVVELASAAICGLGVFWFITRSYT